MRIDKTSCPICNQPVEAVHEIVTVFAKLILTDEHGYADYSGESEIVWDTQTPVGVNGFFTVRCMNDHEWQTKIWWKG